MAKPLAADRLQVNIRIDAEFRDRMDRISRILSHELGLKLGPADLLRMGVSLLEKKYAPAIEAAEERVQHWQELVKMRRELSEADIADADYAKQLAELKAKIEARMAQQEADRQARLKEMDGNL